MNFSEFKKRITAEPGSQDAEILRARHSAPEFEAAAAEAEAFEEELQAAVLIPAPTGLLDEIRAIGQQPVRRRGWIPLALAASLLITAGVVGIAWKQSHQWDSVESYVIDHYSHDGNKIVRLATDIVAERDITRIMTTLGISMDKQLAGRILYIKFCPTPEGRGAHMVVSTEQGPMTIIYMPKSRVTDGETVRFDRQHALLVSLEHGSAAIVGEQAQAFDSLQAVLRKSLKTEPVGV